jgi:hypothetical protein
VDLYLHSYVRVSNLKAAQWSSHLPVQLVSGAAAAGGGVIICQDCNSLKSERAQCNLNLRFFKSTRSKFDFKPWLTRFLPQFKVRKPFQSVSVTVSCA